MFNNDKLNGQGKATINNKTYEGIFHNNQLCDGVNKYGYGTGKLTSLDGVTLEGTFRNGLLYGKGRVINSSSDIIDGWFYESMLLQG